MRRVMAAFRGELVASADAWERTLAQLDAEGGTAPVQELFRLAHSLRGAARTVGLGGLADELRALEDELNRARDQGQIDTGLRAELSAVPGMLAAAIATIEPEHGAAGAPHVTPAMEVLVIEDSHTQAVALERLLAENGFAVRSASTIAGALAELAARPSDVVLLDLELPDATGLSALAELQHRFAGVPVVVLTSHGGDETALRALQEGAEDYLAKEELEPSLLRRLLRYAVERHHTRTDLARMAADLRVKNAALERLDAEKDQLLGIVAHDLRNPLAVVRGYADFLQSGVAGELSEPQSEMLAIVRRTADYMLQLVEDLVDLSRIRAGHMELDRSATDLGALVAESVRAHNFIAQQKGILFTIDRLDPIGELALDAHKMKQVVDNLLSNAAKFSHPGSPVSLRLEQIGGEIHLVVRDRGVGIPADALERVFMPFQKGAARPTAGERSTGLGLAIVRNIVEAHGGRIWVESAVGRGSTFHVELPLQGPTIGP